MNSVTPVGPRSEKLRDVRHLLIDLDGTLLLERGLPLQLDFVLRTLIEFKKYGGWFRAFLALRAMREALKTPVSDDFPEKKSNALRAATAAAKELGLSVDESDHIVRETLEVVFPALRRHFRPIPGAGLFIEWAHRRFPLTLATNPVWPLELVRLRLEWAEVDPSRFQMITHAGEMHGCKPSKEYYLEILKRLSLQPAQCLLIGNDMRDDLPAVRVGIPVFIVSKHASQEGPRSLYLQGSRAPAWKGSLEQIQKMLGDGAVKT